MKSISKYIYESKHSFRIKSHLKKETNYKYWPKNKVELLNAIEKELDNGNTDLNCIDTSRITDMGLLFDKTGFIKLTKEQQETLDISKWDTSNVENMEAMFCNCKNFNSDLSKWDVSNIKYMHFMFNGCTKFNSDLSNWDVSKTICMDNMFKGSRLEGNEPAWYKK